MAGKLPPDNQGGTVTFVDATTNSVIKQRLHPDLEEQVRQIVREEIKAALLELWESNNIDNISAALAKRLGIE